MESRVPEVRSMAATLFRELLIVSQATHVESQTNMPLMLMMLYDHAREITTEAILFQDAFTTRIACPGGVFRRSTYDDAAAMFPPQEDIGDWVLEFDGAVVANGGFLCHYNPPYGDIFMAVSESRRGRGFGSYLVQELKRVCYEAGRKPSARCNPENVASRRTLQRAGLLPCGRLLAGEVAPWPEDLPIVRSDRRWSLVRSHRSITAGTGPDRVLGWRQRSRPAGAGSQPSRPASPASPRRGEYVSGRSCTRRRGRSLRYRDRPWSIGEGRRRQGSDWDNRRLDSVPSAYRESPRGFWSGSRRAARWRHRVGQGRSSSRPGKGGMRRDLQARSSESRLTNRQNRADAGLVLR